ncbi:unnamed protein product [Ectocarpus fasciculatus]
MGLRFPATDIPPVTRKMLRLNGVRFIADTSAPGVPVDLLHERISTALNLSMSALRASSSCHLEYLKNMGVKSSLVVAIVVDEELWGIYSFHSYTRIVAPSCEERITVETVAAVASAMISLHQRKEIMAATLAVSRTLAMISNYMTVDDFLTAESETLLDTLAVDTIVLFTTSRPVVVHGNKEISLSRGECKDLISEAVGDERRIKHIVQILTSNAIKFTPSGGGKVEVSLFVFASPQDTANWWAEQTARFDDHVWIAESPATDDIENMVGELQGSEPGARFISAAPWWYVYCVRDTGVGIQKGDLSQLVMAYRQVSRGVSKEHQGAGLGLNVCKIHVKAMFGGLGIASTISDESNKRRGGTLFAVALPLLRLPPEREGVEPEAVCATCRVGSPNAETLVDATMAMATITNSASLVSGGGDNGDKVTGPHKKIALLVVDDQKMNIKLMEKKIAMVFTHSHTRVQILQATDGKTALEAYRVARTAEANNNGGAGSVVLAGVFMDFHMPNMDGIECTRRIRQNEAERGWLPVRICGITADTTQATRERFQDAGGSDIVYKPWQPGQVEGVCNAMVANMLQEGGEGAAGRGAEGGA